MKLVIIESPFAGDIARNLRYLRAAMHDCLLRGEAPFAPHALYTQPGVLDDANPSHRDLGITAGFAWKAMAERTVVYTDLGVTPGMVAGLKVAQRLCETDDHHIEYRELGPDWEVKARETEAGFATRWP